MGLAENEFLKYLNKFDKCTFEAELDKKKYLIGEGNPEFKLKFNNLPDIEALLESTTIALGEAYMLGDLEIEGDLYEVFNIILKQADRISLDKKALKKIIKNSKSIRSLKKKIKSYYDLDETFRQLVFGQDKSSTIGYYTEDTHDLEQAKHNNITQIIDSLNLREGMSICEITSGGGSLLLEAAAKYKVHGLLVTLSKKQSSEMQDRIKKEQLEELVEVKNIDYRELPKLSRVFDRVISCDMAEYVGKENMPEFFAVVKGVLKKEGMFLMQSVNTAKEVITDLWVKKYIKPGIEIPALPYIIENSLQCGFKIIEMKDMRQHLVKTYLDWNKNFRVNEEEVEEIFDNKFVAGWRLYLNAYAAAYNIGLLDNHQIIFSNGIKK